MPRFVVLMYEDDGAWEKLTKARRAALMKRYMAWAALLTKKGLLRGGSAVGGPGVLLDKKGRTIGSTPWRGKKDVLTGWFEIEAATLAAAVKIARGCPALLHGERVIVRPAGHAED